MNIGLLKYVTSVSFISQLSIKMNVMILEAINSLVFGVCWPPDGVVFPELFSHKNECNDTRSDKFTCNWSMLASRWSSISRTFYTGQLVDVKLRFSSPVFFGGFFLVRLSKIHASVGGFHLFTVKLMVYAHWLSPGPGQGRNQAGTNGLHGSWFPLFRTDKISRLFQYFFQ